MYYKCTNINASSETIWRQGCDKQEIDSKCKNKDNQNRRTEWSKDEPLKR